MPDSVGHIRCPLQLLSGMIAANVGLVRLGKFGTIPDVASVAIFPSDRLRYDAPYSLNFYGIP
jgi:hypothetical protein